MRNSVRAALFVLIGLMAGDLFAQGLTLSGRVTDSKTGEALAGVSVAIPTMNRGAFTDVDGRYSFQLAAGNYQVVATYVGYKRATQNIQIAASNLVLDFSLEADVIGLDQVVVVGYGEVSRRSITGSISSVRGDDVTLTPVNTVENALQGRVSGVFTQQNNGKLGQGIQMRIRGSSSVSASNQPLYVVDGVPVVMDDFSLSSAASNPMAQFNFNDVESIQILKDASAAAIYGSRGANGVVLITTKQGRKGRTQFNYSYQTGFSEPTNTTSRTDMMNAKEYINYMYQAAKNTEARRNLDWVVDEIETVFDTYALGTDWRRCLNTEFGGGGGTCPVDTDWISLAFQDAPMFSHDLSASGGTDATTFFVSGHYSDQDGILINDRYQRISSRLRLDHKASDRISMGMNLSLGRTFHQRLSSDNAFSTPIQLLAMMPISPLYVPDDSALPDYVPTSEFNNDTFYYNGVIHRDFAKYFVTTFRTTGNTYLTYQLDPSLQFRSEFSMDLVTGKDDQWYSPKTAAGFASAGNGGYASVAWQQTASYRTAHYLTHTWSPTTSQNLNTAAGFDYQYNDYNYAFASGSGFPNDSFQRLTSAATVLAGTTTGSEYSFASYFLRSNYDYKGKYLLALSARVDGSSRFGNDNRYGLFPAGSVGWVVSEEGFASGLAGLVPYLKLRASYGVTGNAGIGNFGSLGLWGGGSYAGQSAIQPTQIPNPNLTWETTRQTNLGLDFGLFANRITGEFDVYDKLTEDLLLNVQIPATSGFNTSLRNVGKLENKGWELTVNTFNLVGNFRWNSTFNISNNENKITDLDGQIITAGLASLSRAMEGQPIGVFFAPKFFGVDQTNGDALFSVFSDVDCKVPRSDADGGPSTTNYNLATRCVIGNPNPKFIGGLGNTFSFRGLDVGVQFQFVYGNDAYIGGSGRWSRGNGIFEDNSYREQLNSWTPENKSNRIPQARYLSTNGNQHSSRYISDASYVRLKTVSVGYTVPRQYLNGSGLNRMRFYANGVNLMTWTKYKGFDPEMNTDFLAGNIALGTEFYTAPQSRTITFGIDIGF